MKKLMIIGAGMAQVPLIQASRNENYHTIVCDLNPGAPGVSLANIFYKVSTKDRNGLLEVAWKEKIDGIVANSEYAMCDVAYIANQMNLVGNPESAVDILSSKSNFRALQEKEGLFNPKFLPDNSIEHVLTDSQVLSFPIVIKPDENSGTRSVVSITDPQDHEAIREAIHQARAISRNGKAIAEEYVPMPSQVVIEGEIFLHHGEILWDGLFHTIRSRQLQMIPMTYVFPLRKEEKRTGQLKETLAKAFRAAGIMHGEYNIEMFFTAENEPFLIELNPRQGGNNLPRYVQKSCGIDLTRLLVTTSVGDDEYWDAIHQHQRKENYIIHHMFYPEASGIFRGIKRDDSISAHILKIQIDAAIGEPIQKAEDGSFDIGFVDLSFDDAEEQLQAAIHIGDLIQIDIERE